MEPRHAPTPLSDAIWNRAASADPPPPDARPGDRALHDAMALHGYAMNGGLEHGLDVMGADGVERAAAGWRHLGRSDMAQLLLAALRAVPELPADRERRERFLTDGWSAEQADAIRRLDARYADDDDLEQAFLAHLARQPDDFAPVG